jgi:hypothetical protein
MPLSLRQADVIC